MKANDPLWASLEPQLGKKPDLEIGTDAFLSIAISLKRIADIAETVRFYHVDANLPASDKKGMIAVEAQWLKRLVAESGKAVDLAEGAPALAQLGYLVGRFKKIVGDPNLEVKEDPSDKAKPEQI